jgi:predicted hydrocarbon binding protein
MEQSAQAFASMMKLMFMGMGALSKAFYEKVGKEALPAINDVMVKGGEEWGKIMQPMVPAKSMKAIAESYKMMESMMGMKMDMVNVSDDVLHFRISKCPLGIEGTSKELCEAMMGTDKKMISTILGKEVKMEIPKSVAVGDKECEIIFSTK